MITTDTIQVVAENLRELEIYPKVTDMLNYIIDKMATEFADVENKFIDPNLVDEEVVSEIIREYGFEYINDIAATLTTLDSSLLLHFVSLLNLLKGHRSGLELILRVLGFESVISEWWEQSPKGEPMTFNMQVFINYSQVSGSVFDTLAQIKKFTRFYVFPIFQVADVVFDYEFAEAGTAMAGFHIQELPGLIEATL